MIQGYAWHWREHRAIFFRKVPQRSREASLDGCDFEEVRSLPRHQRGAMVLLGEKLGAQVQSYVKGLRSTGTPIGSSIVIAAAIVKSYD